MRKILVIMENQNKPAEVWHSQKINIFDLYPSKKDEGEEPPLEINNPVPLCYNGVDEVDLMAR